MTATMILIALIVLAVPAFLGALMIFQHVRISLKLKRAQLRYTQTLQRQHNRHDN